MVARPYAGHTDLLQHPVELCESLRCPAVTTIDIGF